MSRLSHLEHNHDTGDVESIRDQCPAYIAGKARPRASPAKRFDRGREALEQVPVSAVMDALDEVEFQNRSVADLPSWLGRQRRQLHQALRAYVETIVATYPFHPTVDEVDLIPVANWWFVTHQSAEWHREVFAWGRRYQSVDGRIRELRLLKLGASTLGRPLTSPQLATAALVTACGDEVAWPKPWTEPAPVRQHVPQALEWVRVTQVSLADGKTEVLFNDSPAAARAAYKLQATPAIKIAVNGTERRPGSDCADCGQLGVCDALVSTPGVLGIEANKRAPVRTVSATTLRYHNQCPTQAHVWALKLPRDNEYSRNAIVGHAVHAWLERQHATPQPCRLDDLPADDAWNAGRWSLRSAEEIEAAQQMLRSHLDTCPIVAGAEITDIRPESTVVAFDPAARAVVNAKADLLYRENGAWVWRETKTTTRPSFVDDADVLTEYPQLALGVLLLSAGALGEPSSRMRVELEFLTPGGGDIVQVPVTTEHIAYARTVIGRQAEAWRSDNTFAPRPSRECRWCPVRVWCPAPQQEIDDD